MKINNIITSIFLNNNNNTNINGVNFSNFSLDFFKNEISIFNNYLILDGLDQNNLVKKMKNIIFSFCLSFDSILKNIIKENNLTLEYFNNIYEEQQEISNGFDGFSFENQDGKFSTDTIKKRASEMNNIINKVNEYFLLNNKIIDKLNSDMYTFINNFCVGVI